MNNFKSYALATVGLVCLVVSLALNLVRANNAGVSTITASTAHFNPGNTYHLTPANGGSQISCNVSEVDGAWLKCQGQSLAWVNTNTMMASDR